MNSQLLKTATLFSGIIGKSLIIEIDAYDGATESKINVINYVSAKIKGFEYIPSLENSLDDYCIILHVQIFTISNLNVDLNVIGNETIYLSSIEEFIKFKNGEIISFENSLYETKEKLNCCLIPQ